MFLLIQVVAAPKTLFEAFEFIVDTCFNFAKRIVKCILETIVLLFLLGILVTVIAPRFVLFYLHTCWHIDECPELMELRSRKAIYYYILELCIDAVRPIWELFWEMYYQYLLRRAFSDLLSAVGFAGVQVLVTKAGFRSLGIAEDFFITQLRELRIIFDSGASTNLIFDTLPGDPVVGPKDLNLAAGEKSTGHITVSGEVLMPIAVKKKCSEQLISMGRYSWRCGKVVMWGGTCQIFICNKDGSQTLLYTLPLVNNCPMMTDKQAQHVRELQRAALSGEGFQQLGEDGIEFEFSPSLALLDKTSELFDAYYFEEAFSGHEELFEHFLPSELAFHWEEAKLYFVSSPVTTFLFQLALLRREQIECNQSISDAASITASFHSNVGGFPDCEPSADPTSAKVSSTRSHEQRESDVETEESDQLSPHYSRVETPLSLTFEKVTAVKLKHGSNPNAMKAPQGKTPLQDKLKFYKSTKGAWVIWGDVHKSSQLGFDSSEYTWVYHCSRLQPKNPTKPKLDEIETVELNFPMRDNTGQMACAGLRHCLECLGIWTDNAKQKINFYFESEDENSLDAKLVEEYILSCHGSHHFSVPYRHPAKEFAVKNLLTKIRSQLDQASLPASAWPAVARALNEQACSGIKDRPYPNRTFLKGYTADMVGRSVNVFVPGLKRGSVDNKQVPSILLNSAPRDRVWIIHATDKELGFRCTQVQWAQVSFSETEKWVFETDQLNNLRLLKYMKAKFQPTLLAKKKIKDTVLPRTVTCPRCIRLEKKGEEKDCEHEHPVKGHHCDKGCHYNSYDCFTNPEFSTEVHRFCPMACILEEVLTHKRQSTNEQDLHHMSISDADGGNPRFRSCFEREVKSNTDDYSRFKELVKAFEDPLLRDQVFHCHAQPTLARTQTELDAEQCATLLFLARESIHSEMFRNVELEIAKNSDKNKEGYSPQEYYGMIIVKNKDVLAQCEKCPRDLMEWLEANNKELENLIDRGVLKVVKMSELKNLDRDSYELIPSLVVYSIKNTGRKKARLVACGNYQIPADKETEGLQSGVYAGTTSQIVWRSLINIFAQSRNSVAAMDVSEAFTQTDEHSQGKRGIKTFLRLPSQWKSRILPSVLKNAGCDPSKYSEFLLQVLKSIYGETFAPKRWQETLKRVLLKHNFRECHLEESLYFKIHNGKIIVISTYVDDIWFFSQDADEMVKLMYLISLELRCTPGEVLCGAPDWMFDETEDTSASPAPDTKLASTATASPHQPISGAEERAQSLTSEQQNIKAFFKPLKGPPRFGVATKDEPLSYVSIDIYFEGDFLVLDQSKYVEKSYNRMKEKGVFGDADVLNVHSLRAETFNHLHLFEPKSDNPLLSKQELSFLRIGVNTLSFYALSVGIGLQAALGQIARGQAAGRKRHLDALKLLIFYAYQNRNSVLKLECPSYATGEFNTLAKLKIFSTAHCDSSMGSSSTLGTDAHARQGCVIMIGVFSDMEGIVQGKSSLQTTVALSTCEAELTASSWCAKIIIGLVNLFKEIFDGATIEIPRLFADNKAANLLASNQASMRNHRHLMLPQIWIRQQTKNDAIKIFDIYTHLNTSDMLTKVLPHDKLIALLKLLGYTV